MELTEKDLELLRELKHFSLLEEDIYKPVLISRTL